MRHYFCLALALMAQPVFSGEMNGQDNIAKGLLGAFRGCETWVLDPASWIDGTKPFMAAVNLGDEVSEVTLIPDELKPPQGLRQGNRTFRIDVSDRAGFALTVSTDIPMCHIVGVGFGDFANSIASILGSQAFRASWIRSEEQENGSSTSVVFRHRQDDRFHLTLSQPNPSATRPPTIHLLATAVFDPR